MYQQLRQRPGNVFFSPFGIRTALAMTWAGARVETEAQMKEALRISSSNELLHANVAEIVQRLNAAGTGDCEMVAANSVWIQDGAPLQPAFIDLIARHYRSAMNLVDFRRGVEAARVIINRWVESETRQKIRELIPSGRLDADTLLVLVNAVYFKGIWALQFHQAATRDEPFHLPGGGKVKAPLMHQQEEVRYLHARSYQAVDLVYRSGNLSLLVLLPDRRDGLPDLERALTVRMLDDCVAQMTAHRVELFLPRFKITWGTVNMSDRLTAVGMPLALARGRANFSGINGHEPPHVDSLFISAVFHKAFVEMNEVGTEAAAATAVDMRPAMSAFRPSSAPRVPVFRADRPFLFAIRDRATGAFLFLGRLTDPTRDG
jgi:serpin B